MPDATILDSTTTPRSTARVRIILLVGALCAAYMVSMFLRGSLAVFVPDLAREFALPPTSLGFLGSIYALTFAAAQIPVGIAIDRYGARRTILASIGVVILGCLVFSVATNLSQLAIARALEGVGCASLFMAAISVYAAWFPRERFSTFTGVQLGVGTLGAIIATAPLAALVGAAGWRASFLVVAAWAALAGLAVGTLVRDRPPGAARPQGAPDTLLGSLDGVLAAARTHSALRMAFLQFAAYPSFATVLILWGGPWLADVYGMDLKARGDALFIMVAAQAAGLFLWGPADRVFLSYKRPVVVGCAASVALLAAAAVWPVPIAVLPAFLAAFGLATAFLPVMTAHGRALFPDGLVGRGLTVINVGTMLGLFALQFGAGHIIGAFPGTEVQGRMTYPPEAYRAMFAMLALVLAAATALYLGARDPRATSKA